MVGLAFAVAASANFPALLLALTWKRFNTTGAVTGVLSGVVTLGRAGADRARRARGSDRDHPRRALSQPAIISVPLGFLGCILGTMLSREESKAERGFDELHVRSETGLGAEVRDRGRRALAAAPRRRASSAEREPATTRADRRRLRGSRAPALATPAVDTSKEDRWRSQPAIEGGQGLEAELGELLDQETFEPPDEFRDAALVTDESLHEEAARDPEAWWLKLAGELDWFTEPTTGPRRLRTRRSTSGSPTARSTPRYNCLDRHVEAGNGDRVAFHWRGEEGEEREVTYADLHRDVQRLANVLHGPRGRGRRRRRHLPADDPRGRGRDARLRADRRPAQRRLRRLLAGRGQGADAVLRGEGADHGRRAPGARARRAEIKPAVDDVPRRGAVDRDRDRRPQHRRRRRDDRGPRRLLRRGDRGRRRRVPAGRARRRAPALHPLLLGLDGEAEGDPAHHRRLPDRGRLDAPGTSST